MSGEPERHDDEERSLSEKIRRVQDLWDDIARNPGKVKLTPGQLEEVERRLRRHEESPGNYSSWEDVKSRLEDRR